MIGHMSALKEEKMLETQTEAEVHQKLETLQENERFLAAMEVWPP